MKVNRIYNTNCLDGLKKIPDNSIHCCVTSPPYYGLRDYGTASWHGGDDGCDHSYQKGGRNPETSSKQISNTGTTISQYEKDCSKCGAIRIDDQIGLEETPEAYVAKLVEVFTEVKRVLRDDGTLWLNLGDSYWWGKGQSGSRGNEFQEQRNVNGESINKGYQTLGGAKETRPTDKRHEFIKAKDLIGIPWLVAFALRSHGWYLRQDIIWHKPNPMPESVTDRCTKSHEYIFLLTKSAKYYYDADAIKTEISDTSVKRLMQGIDLQTGSARVPFKTNGNMKAVGHLRKNYKHRSEHGDKTLSGHTGNIDSDGNIIGGGLANKRSVWTVTTKPYSDAHFATFPEDLIVDMIKAGCPENGIVLDPFMGAGTTALVAAKLNRKYIGFELNADYINIAEKRLRSHLGMFNPSVLTELAKPINDKQAKELKIYDEIPFKAVNE